MENLFLKYIEVNNHILKQTKTQIMETFKIYHVVNSDFMNTDVSLQRKYVGKVKADSLSDAFKIAQNDISPDVHSHWSSCDIRSTSIGDAIVDSDNIAFIVEGGSFNCIGYNTDYINAPTDIIKRNSLILQLLSLTDYNREELECHSTDALKNLVLEYHNNMDASWIAQQEFYDNQNVGGITETFDDTAYNKDGSIKYQHEDISDTDILEHNIKLLADTKKAIRKFHKLYEYLSNNLWNNNKVPSYPEVVIISVIIQNMQFSGVDCVSYNHNKAIKELRVLATHLKKINDYHNNGYMTQYAWNEIDCIMMYFETELK